MKSKKDRTKDIEVIYEQLAFEIEFIRAYVVELMVDPDNQIEFTSKDFKKLDKIDCFLAQIKADLECKMYNNNYPFCSRDVFYGKEVAVEPILKETREEMLKSAKDLIKSK